MIYARTCGCGREVTYKTVYTWKRALEKSSMCPSCRTSYLNKLPQRLRKGQRNHAWKGTKDVSGKVLSKLKRDAKTRNISFEITIEDIQRKLEEQNYKCGYTGWSVEFGNNASVDRIDSSKGYTTDNIHIVDKTVNIAKRDYSHEYFIKMCKAVAGHCEI